MSTEIEITQSKKQRNPMQILSSADLKKFISEIRLGGIRTIPAFMATRWGIPETTAQRLINQHQINSTQKKVKQ